MGSLFKVTVLFVCALLTQYSCDAAAFKDCGSSLGSFTEVIIDNCKLTDSACVLKRGTNATATIKFKTTKDVDAINAVVHGDLMGNLVPFNLPDPDACVGHGITCPVTTDQEVTYTTTLNILRSYPKIPLKIKWQLQTSSGEDIACVIIPAIIQ